MAVNAEYLGMPLRLSDLDTENLEYFRHCAAHQFHLQACTECNLLRYPPTTACPWCSNRESRWVPVEAKGTVHSYSEVHHAIQRAFRDHVPYLILLVDLDTQKGKPTEHEALRIAGNLATRAVSTTAACSDSRACSRRNNWMAPAPTASVGSRSRSQ